MTGNLFTQETAQEALMFALQTATKRKAFVKAYVQVTARDGNVPAETLEFDKVLVGPKGGKYGVYKPQTLKTLEMDNRTFQINNLLGKPSLAFMVTGGNGGKAPKDSVTEWL